MHIYLFCNYMAIILISSRTKTAKNTEKRNCKDKIDISCEPQM